MLPEPCHPTAAARPPLRRRPSHPARRRPAAGVPSVPETVSVAHGSTALTVEFGWGSTPPTYDRLLYRVVDADSSAVQQGWTAIAPADIAAARFTYAPATVVAGLYR